MTSDIDIDIGPSNHTGQGGREKLASIGHIVDSISQKISEKATHAFASLI